MNHVERYQVALGAKRPPSICTHFDFQNWPVYSVLSGIDDARGAPARPGATGRDFYIAACRLTKFFLDATLRGDREAMRYIRGDVGLPGIGGELLTFSARQ